MNRTSWSRYHEVKLVVRERFPLAFPPSGAPMVPLAIGIHRVLREALKGVVPRENIRPFIRGWVGRLAYRQAVAAGGQRIGLDGQPCGEVEEAHRLEAAARIYADSAMAGPHVVFDDQGALIAHRVGPAFADTVAS